MTTNLTVELDAGLHERLKDEAHARGRSEDDVLSEALKEYFDAHQAEKSCYDLALEAGLIGAIKGLPPDLSTNPKYMEGFGRD